MKKKGRFFIPLGLLLIAAALFWTGRNIIIDRQAAARSQSALEQLQSAIPQVSLQPVETPNPEPSIDDTRPQETEVPDYVLDPAMEMPTERIDGLDYIGYLSLPTLNLELPIVSQWSYDALNTAPCRYYGSVYSGDLVIAGHNYTQHFATLQSLKTGDRLTFIDVDGNVFSYEVVLCEALEANAVKEMTQSDYDLTLFSCTVGGRHRVTVRCDRIDETIGAAS